MIVDDDEFNLDALKRILLRFCVNVKILSFFNGYEALKHINNEFLIYEKNNNKFTRFS